LTEAFVIHFPKPERITEAFFTALVFPKTNGKAAADAKTVRYFTCELGLGHSRELDAAIFCEWTVDGRHVNYGAMKNNTAETFVEAINAFMHGNKGTKNNPN